MAMMFPISFCEWDSPLPGLRSCKTETRKLCGQIFERTIDTGGPELPFLFVHATRVCAAGSVGTKEEWNVSSLAHTSTFRAAAQNASRS